MTSPRILIGASGWAHRGWIGPLYPKGLRQSDWLNWYSCSFPMVEIDAAFTGKPQRETLMNWRADVPGDFVFSIRAPRAMTHGHKMLAPAKHGAAFFEAVSGLGGKGGPVVFTLPENWNVNVDRLVEFLDALPEGHDYVFELQDKSWQCPDVYKALRRQKAVLAMTDKAGAQSPQEQTGRFDYIRLYGPGSNGGGYSDDALAQWAGRIAGWAQKGRDVYAVFCNADSGHAPRDAQRLMEMAGIN